MGRFTPPAGVSGPILDLLADHRPRSLGQIEQAVAGSGVGLAKIVDILMTLRETSDLGVAQEESVIRAARPHAERLNIMLSERAERRATKTMLASPVIGAPLVYHERIVHFFWRAVREGRRNPDEVAAYAAGIYRSEGTVLVEAEKRYLSGDEGSVALLAEARFFWDKILPLFRALQVL